MTYWVSFIIQNKDDKKAWCCAKNTGFLSLDEAMKVVETVKEQNIVLSVWVDLFDETNNKTTVYHECFVDCLYNNVFYKNKRGKKYFS